MKHPVCVCVCVCVCHYCLYSKVTTHTHTRCSPAVLGGCGFDRADRGLSLVVGRCPAANHSPPPIRAKGIGSRTFYRLLCVCVCVCVCVFNIVLLNCVFVQSVFNMYIFIYFLNYSTITLITSCTNILPICYYAKQLIV